MVRFVAYMQQIVGEYEHVGLLPKRAL